MELKSGDIIFCSYASGELSDAIDEVTQTEKATNYSHMGLIEIIHSDTFVIHAALKRGVVKETVQDFLFNDKPTLVDVYRLKDTLQYSIAAALIRANTLIGLPYNAHYNMNDSCYYCSQLVYEAFIADEMFTLEPMTFKNPDSTAFNPGWVKHYKALNMEIPEGELGCNPNGLAASSAIHYVGELE